MDSAENVAIAQPITVSASVAKSKSLVKAAEGRLFAIDALRGIAILAMSLRHTAYFLRYPLQAETYGGQSARLLGWPYWVSGLLANITAPTFFLLIGVSLALLVNGRRKAGDSEWAITRFLIVRAGFLLLLDLTVCEITWAGPRPYTHVLLSIAIAMVVLSVARLLPYSVLAGISLVMVVGYQLWLPVFTPLLSETRDFGLALLLTYSTLTRPATEFSILGWLPLPMLGFVLGQWVSSPAFRKPRPWVLIGTGLLGIWLVLRATNVLNEPTAFSANAPWYEFFIMSKTPPSLTFLTFNLGLSALTLAVLCMFNERLDRPPMQWLVICGQASLFFFVAHIVVYGLATRVVLAFQPPISPIIFEYAIWFAGLVLLIPLAYYYRRLRRKYPRSLLRYL